MYVKLRRAFNIVNHVEVFMCKFVNLDTGSFLRPQSCREEKGSSAGVDAHNLELKPSPIFRSVGVSAFHFTRELVVRVVANVNVSAVTQVQLEVVARPAGRLVDQEVAPLPRGVRVSALHLTRDPGVPSDIDVSAVYKVEVNASMRTLLGKEGSPQSAVVRPGIRVSALCLAEGVSVVRNVDVVIIATKTLGKADLDVLVVQLVANAHIVVV